MQSKSFIIYDADCGFCESSMERLRKILADRIDYIPRTQIPNGAYGINNQESNKAIQFVEINDNQYQVYSAAHAIFKALSYNSAWGFVLFSYKYIPGFAWVSEWLYSIVAKYRSKISSCKVPSS